MSVVVRSREPTLDRGAIHDFRTLIDRAVLSDLHEEFAERTRNAVSDRERNAVQDDIQNRLVQEGNP